MKTTGSAYPDWARYAAWGCGSGRMITVSATSRTSSAGMSTRLAWFFTASMLVGL